MPDLPPIKQPGKIPFIAARNARKDISQMGDGPISRTPGDASACANNADISHTLQSEPLMEDVVQQDIAQLDTIKSEVCPTLTGAQDDIAQLDTLKSKIPVDADVQEAAQKDIARLDTIKSEVHVERGEDIAQLDTVRSPALNPALTNTKRLSRARLLHFFLLALLVLPLAVTLVGAGVGYSMYAHARDGVQQLSNVKAIFTANTAHSSGILDERKLHLAQQELQVARGDFQQLQIMLSQDTVASVLANTLPQQLVSARALSRVGIDVTDIGMRLVQTALLLAPTFHSPLLSDATKPLVTPATLQIVRATIDAVLPSLNDIQMQARSVSLAVLPISKTQLQQLTQLFRVVPQMQTALTQARGLVGAAGWLLGVGEPRSFLVQTMDRAELRPTGGFTGQFGELLIANGRIAPFSLKNIGPYEEFNPTSLSNGALAPAPYRAWWPIPNWGLRDSNISADFPTSARFAMQTYKYEFGRQVDGVIAFSPFLIMHVLQVTGPIPIPAYAETITAQNLEERLHYYQLDNVGIRKEELIEHVVDTPQAPAQARKLFTARLARVLMDHVRHAPPDELILIARALLHDLQTKDMQVYMVNPQIEHLLVQYGAAGQLDRSTAHDGLYIVQANLSASKASQYVKTVIQDSIALNAQGGVTHKLKLSLIYRQEGPVYGLDTYRDYVRIYVPPDAQFRGGSGFDSGLPFCGGAFFACPQHDVYGDGSLLCPPGVTDAGYATSMLGDPYLHSIHPIDRIGPPTNLSSDEAGRAMFGGWLVLPKDCTLTATLSWYVPPTGSAPYTLLVQRQASTLPILDVTINAASCSPLKTSHLHFSGIMNGEDLSFSPSLPRLQNGATCYMLPGT